MRWKSDAGAALIETLIAVGLLAGLAAGLAHAVVAARRAVALAGADTVATLAAVQKLEELRALDWAFDPRTGRRVTDTTTDLARDGRPGSGPGLGASPPGALTREPGAPGWMDYLDAGGGWVGAGPQPPAGAAWVRRWAVAPLAGDPDVLVLQVVVVDRREAFARPRRAVRPNDPGVTWLATLRARR